MNILISPLKNKYNNNNMSSQVSSQNSFLVTENIIQLINSEIRDGSTNTAKKIAPKPCKGNCGKYCHIIQGDFCHKCKLSGKFNTSALNLSILAERLANLLAIYDSLSASWEYVEYFYHFCTLLIYINMTGGRANANWLNFIKTNKIMPVPKLQWSNDANIYLDRVVPLFKSLGNVVEIANFLNM